MINWSKIIESDISGLTMEELNFVFSSTFYPSGPVSSDSGLTSDQADALDMFDSVDISLTDSQQKEIHDSEVAAEVKTTALQTKQHVAKFEAFLKDDIGISQPMISIPSKYLVEYMRLFFVRLRKMDGTDYAPPSLACIRASLHRHMLSATGIGIIGNSEYEHFEKTYKAAIVRSLRQKSSTLVPSGFQPIEEEDLLRLQTYFNQETPARLQDEVFYLLMSHFAFRGREALRGLTKGDIVFGADASGHEFVDLLKEKKEKCVKVDSPGSLKQIGIFALPGDPKCPVKTIRTYLSKLPAERSDLFPKPLAKWQGSNWYTPKSVLGKNTLNTMMKNMSIRAGLSKPYTNHCIRPTVITGLAARDVPVEHIQVVSGHKTAESVQRYTKKLTLGQKRSLSQTISENLLCRQTVTFETPETIVETVAKKTELSCAADSTALSIQNDSTTAQAQCGNVPTLVLEKNGAKLTVYL